MDYRFRSGHNQELRSGGKIIHDRRHLPPFSPYSRPSNSALPLALPAPELEAQRSPSWFRGLISGAGKLISSVLGSQGSPSSPSESSSSYSFEEEYDPHSNEHVNHLLFDGEADYNVNMRGVVEGDVEPLAIVSKSETKLVIEQLLMQETFTRAECSKLIEILRSRMLNCPSANGGEDIQNTASRRVSDKRSWQSLKQNKNLSGTSYFSPGNLSAVSPRYYASEAISPNLRDEAVMEAKRWFEEKKLSPRPRCDQQCGPCILNTDMNQYCFNGDDDSPIEMAKSYLQALPPWRSPSFSSASFKNSSSSGKRPCSYSNHLFPTSKVRKSDYTDNGSWDSKQASRVSLKSADNERIRSKLRQAGSTTRSLALESFRVSSPTSNFGDKAQDDGLKLHNRKAVDIGRQMEQRKEISPVNITEPEKIFKAAERLSMVIALTASDHLISDSDAMPLSDEKQAVDASFVTNAQDGSISVHQDSLALALTTFENGVSFSEIETTQLENDAPGVPSRQIAYDKAKFLAYNTLEVNPASDFEHTQSLADLKPSCGNPAIEKYKAARTTGKSHINSKPNSSHESVGKERPTASNSSNGCYAGSTATIVSEGVRVPSIHTSVNSNTTKPQNDKMQKSTGQQLIGPAEPGRVKRRTKKVVTQGIWKG